MAGERTLTVRILGDVKDVLEKLGLTETRLGSFGSTAVKGFAVAGVAAAGLGIALFKVGEDFEHAYNTIRVGTGATGEALKGLEESFKNVAKTVPDSFGNISQAITLVNEKLGLTGKPLEELSTQLLTLSRITKTDLAGNVDAVTSLFNNWGVATGDQSDKLDELFNASQTSGVSVGELASTMASSGAKLRESGLSFNQTASLIALLGKNGVDASTVMAPLGKAIGAAAKAHVDAGTFIIKTFNDIKSSATDLGNNEALKIFGARGIQLAQLIREGKLSYQDFMQTVMNSTDTIGAAGEATLTLSDKMKILKNEALVALEPIAMKVVDAVTKLVDWFSKLSPKMQLVAVGVVAFTVGLGPLIHFIESGTLAVQGLGKALLFVADNPVVLIIAAVIALGVALVYAYNHSEEFRHVVQAVFGAVGSAAQTMATIATTAFDWIKNHIGLLIVIGLGPLGVAINLLRDNWSTVWNGLASVVAAVWAVIQPVLKEMGRAISDVAGPLKTVLGAAGKVGGAVGGVLSHIPGLNAAGTPNWSGGPTWVGENGPELVNVPPGASIGPAHDPGRYMKPGSNFTFHQTFNEKVDAAKVATETLWKIRRIA